MNKTDLFIILLIVILSIATLKDLFRGQFYTSHDGIHQVVRLYNYDQAFRDGQVPPRWAGSLQSGYGYPLFIFSFHLPWMIAEPIHLLGFSIFDSIKITFLLTFVISGVTMYFFQKELFSRLAALVGTFLYLFAPYRFSNIFVREAIGDATTFIFAPLVFWSLWRLRKKFSWRSITIGAIGVAGLILSHAMVFLLFYLPIFLYLIYSYLFEKEKRDILLRFFTVNILGFGLSSFYLFPSVIERSNTQFQSLMKNIFTGSYFVELSELIYSPWGYGTFHAKEGAMSLQLGLAQWSAVMLAFILIVINIFRFKKLTKQKRTKIVEGGFYLFIFFLTIFMTLEPSKPLWDIVSNIAIIDFPWRFLAVSTFAASLCAGFVIFSAKRSRLILSIFLLSLALYANRNHLRINKSLDWELPFYLLLEKTTNTYDEYNPKWIKKEFLKQERKKVEFSDSSAIISSLRNKTNRIEFNLKANKDGILKINTAYYPGWEVYLNGISKDINYQDEGIIKIPVGQGKYKVLAVFKDTVLRKMSNLLTLITFIIIILGFKKYKQA